MIATYSIFIILYCLAPAGVLWLCRKVKWLGKIGPVIILYFLGVIIGNVTEVPKDLLKVLGNVTVPLAIPLMLYSCSFNKGDAKDQFKALITGLISVTASIVIGYLIFGKNMEDGAKIGGLLTGSYTGGTINMASLKNMLDVNDETFILLNTYDMVICFLYLTFLLCFGIKLFRKILPVKTLSKRKNNKIKIEEEQNPYKGIFTKKGLKDASFLLAITLVICGISAATGMAVPRNAFMVIFILMLTTLGISASFIKKIKEKQYSQEIGMYFIYIFSIVVASMADLDAINLSRSANSLGFLTVIIFGSLILQTIFAMIFRIDSDTMVISSVAFINSPPFVPMIAASMRNKRVLLSGLSIGIIGYAIGNYLGFLIYKLLLIL